MFIKWIFLAAITVFEVDAQCHSQSTFAQVGALLKDRQYETAFKTLLALSRCSGLSSLERFQIGWLYGRARHFRSALDLFSSVPENVPDILTHNFAVALSQFELQDYGGTVDSLKRLQSQVGLDSKCANLLAVAYSKRGLYAEAYAVLDQEIQNHPDDFSAYLNMVTACAEGGDLAKAGTVAAEASKVFPQSSEVMVVKGAAKMLLGQLDQAEDDFASAVRLAPHEAEPRFFLALAELKEGKYSEAVNVLQSSLRSGIRDSDLHYLFAECLLKITPVDQSGVLAQLNRAIELNSNSVSARTLRGRLLLENGQSKQAIPDLQLANKLDATSRSAAYNLARAYQAAGRTADAKSLFSRLRSETGDTLTELGNKRLNRALTPSAAAGDSQ